jgi:hypothetical protein
MIKLIKRAGVDVRLLVVGMASSATSASASVISGAGMVEEDGPTTGIHRP